MKRYMLSLVPVLLLITVCSKEAPTFPWSEGTFEESKEIAGSRVIQMEFYTDT